MAASRSLPFDQVEKLAHEIDTVEEMEAAVEDPEALLPKPRRCFQRDADSRRSRRCFHS